ncbi:TIM barrel protein [Chelativorans sp.]|uniref:sugar phosphate isomerase/epimerase family protein n=1 Tax=Chelativorans sp. TaxID=2203393 RepID=UPI002811430B|nr:TIM barrel protein [Chelativorans sp.]
MSVLSLHHLTMIDAHPLDLIDAAAAGGFSHCGIRLIPPRKGDPFIDVLSDPTEIPAIGRRLRETGIRLLDIEAVWIASTTDLETLRAPFEVGARLGAEYVLVVGYDDNRARLLESFGHVCELARSLGLKVALEFITYTSLKTLDEVASFIKEAAQPDAGMLIDVLQFFRAGCKPEEIAQYDPKLFSYLQICDGLAQAPVTIEDRRFEARSNRRLPGRGELPVSALMHALPRGLPISLEAPTPELNGFEFREQGRIAGEATRTFLSECGVKS